MLKWYIMKFSGEVSKPKITETGTSLRPANVPQMFTTNFVNIVRMRHILVFNTFTLSFLTWYMYGPYSICIAIIGTDVKKCYDGNIFIIIHNMIDMH